MGQILVKNLVKQYSRRETVVDNINLEINDKEFVVLVGPSGCGKSTILRMLAGLEKITAGEIFFDGNLVNDLPPRLRNISMVFQSYALYPHLTIKENLSFGLKIAKLNNDEIEKRVEWVSAILELTPYLDRKPGALSGGQRQRVAMGRAMARDSNIFLFDEPLSNLDAKLRNKMRFEIKQLHGKIKKTIVYVTHDQVEAMTLADRIVVMKDGKIQQQGLPLDVFNNPVNKFVATFIGSPSMNMVEGFVENNVVKLKDGFCLEIPQRYRALVEQGQEVIVGVRSDSIIPEKNANVSNYQTFKETVIATEPLGTETNLFIHLGGAQFISRMSTPIPVSLGNQLDFFINLDKTYFFDKQTELAIQND